MAPGDSVEPTLDVRAFGEIDTSEFFAAKDIPDGHIYYAGQLSTR